MIKVKKENKIEVIKEWIWYICDEGCNKEAIDKYEVMVDNYFKDKEDVSKSDFEKIWNEVCNDLGGGQDSESFEENWYDIENGILVGKSW